MENVAALNSPFTDLERLPRAPSRERQVTV